MKMRFKKIATMLTAAMLLVGTLSTTAMAANVALPPETGTLTVHKYLMDDITEANGPNNGHEAGTNGNPEIPGSAKPINDIKFDVYKVTIPEGGQVPTDGDYRVDSMTNATKLTSGTAPNEVVFDVEKKETLTTAGGTAEAPLGVATSGDLAQGFYLVLEQADPRVSSPAAPFVVAVPMTNPTTNGWIQNVHVYPKNEKMSSTKTPDITSVELGETVKWTIDASIPTEIATGKAFSITDIMDEALNYTAGTVKVTGLMSKDAADGTDIPATGNWTETLTAATNALKVDFTAPGGLTELAKYKFVRISFDTTVNDKILDRVDHSVTNKATVDFTNRYDQDKETETPETKIHTGSIAINKTDANDGKGSKVVGAEFQIASSEANAKASNYLKKNADGKIVDFGETGYDTASPWIETTVAGATADDPAIAMFQGLKDYIDGTPKAYLSYWLVETKAPAGYNLLAAPVKVDFTEANSSAETIYTVTSPIKNTTDFTLPQTGGMGTMIFTIGGITLIGLAAILLVMTKKKNQAKK